MRLRKVNVYTPIGTSVDFLRHESAILFAQRHCARKTITNRLEEVSGSDHRVIYSPYAKAYWSFKGESQLTERWTEAALFFGDEGAAAAVALLALDERLVRIEHPHARLTRGASNMTASPSNDHAILDTIARHRATVQDLLDLPELVKQVIQDLGGSEKCDSSSPSSDSASS